MSLVQLLSRPCLDRSRRLPYYVLLIHISAAWMAYVFGKFACKICIQVKSRIPRHRTCESHETSLRLGILVRVPRHPGRAGHRHPHDHRLRAAKRGHLLLQGEDRRGNLNTWNCRMYYYMFHYLKGTIPDYLYFDCPSGDFLEDFISNQHGWIWIVWLLSQVTKFFKINC